MGKGKRGHPRCPFCGRVYRGKHCHYCQSKMSEEEWAKDKNDQQLTQLAIALLMGLAFVLWQALSSC